MKKTYLAILATFIFGIMFMPWATYAQFGPGTPGDTLGSGQVGDTLGPGTPGGDTATKGGSDATPLKNPIRVNTIPEFVEAALNIVLTIGVPIVAFFIILSGFMFVVARGNAEKLESAKRTFLYTLIGAALLLGAWVIAQLIQSTVDALK